MPAHEADLPELAELENDLFGDDAWSPAQLAAELTSDHHRLLVHPDSSWSSPRELPGSAMTNRCAGYVATVVAGDLADLLRIGVRPECRRAGVATALLAAACALARRDGAERMLLEVSAANSGAIAFYERHDFVRIDTRAGYYRDGTDALILQRDLGAGSGPGTIGG